MRIHLTINNLWSANLPINPQIHSDFGQLDSMYQLFANMLYYVFGQEKLKKIAGKNTQKKIRKIQKGNKEYIKPVQG